MTTSDLNQFVSDFFGPSCPEEFIRQFASPDTGGCSTNLPPAEDTDAEDVEKRKVLVRDVLGIKRGGNRVPRIREAKECETSMPRSSRNHSALPFGRAGYSPSTPIRNKDVK